MQSEFPSVGLADTDTLGECIQKVYTKTRETFIIFMDENNADYEVTDKIIQESKTLLGKEVRNLFYKQLKYCRIETVS